MLLMRRPLRVRFRSRALRSHPPGGRHAGRVDRADGHVPVGSTAHSRFLARGGTLSARLRVPLRACGGLCAAIHGLLARRRWCRCRAP